MADAYVMKVCATCVHFQQIKPAGIFKDVSECTNPDVPATIVLAAPFASRWGCILHASRLPVVEAPDPVD